MPKVIGINKHPEDILNDITNRITSRVNEAIGSYNYKSHAPTNGYNSSNPDYYTDDKDYRRVPTSAIGWPPGLQEYIQRCVLHAFRELLDNIYTDQDLENDLNLK
jgi:hypothetical protein